MRCAGTKRRGSGHDDHGSGAECVRHDLPGLRSTETELPGACSLNARTRRRFAGRPLIIGLLAGVMPRGWMKYIVKGSAVLVVTLGLSMLVKGIRLFGM